MEVCLGEHGRRSTFVFTISDPLWAPFALHSQVVQDMSDVQGWLIGAAAIPGFIITALFYFDHNVSSQLAQQKEFALKKPPAYSYDFMLLAFMVCTYPCLVLQEKLCNALEKDKQRLDCSSASLARLASYLPH